MCAALPSSERIPLPRWPFFRLLVFDKLLQCCLSHARPGTRQESLTTACFWLSATGLVAVARCMRPARKSKRVSASTLGCRARDKRQLNESYQRTQKLGDPDDEVDDVAAWVTKSRTTAQEAKTAARAKAAAEARRRQEQEVRADFSGSLVCPVVVGVLLCDL